MDFRTFLLEAKDNQEIASLLQDLKSYGGNFLKYPNKSAFAEVFNKKGKILFELTDKFFLHFFKPDRKLGASKDAMDNVLYRFKDIFPKHKFYGVDASYAGTDFDKNVNAKKFHIQIDFNYPYDDGVDQMARRRADEFRNMMDSFKARRADYSSKVYAAMGLNKNADEGVLRFETRMASFIYHNLNHIDYKYGRDEDENYAIIYDRKIFDGKKHASYTFKFEKEVYVGGKTKEKDKEALAKIKEIEKTLDAYMKQANFIKKYKINYDSKDIVYERKFNQGYYGWCSGTIVIYPDYEGALTYIPIKSLK